MNVPAPSSVAAERRMRACRATNTRPEIDLRSCLHRLGLRFRIHRPLVSGGRRKADIVFVRARVAVFVDGCFWHGCPKHWTSPKSNADFWCSKIAENKTRDADTNRRLRAAGWRVIRVWEHEDPAKVARRVFEVVRSRGTE